MPADQVIIVLVVLLGIAMFMTGVSHLIRLPHTILLVIVGILIGSRNMEVLSQWR